MNQLLWRAALAMGLVALTTQLATAFVLNARLADHVLGLMSGPAQLFAEDIARTPPPERRERAKVLAQRLGYPVSFQDLLSPGPPRTVARAGKLWVVAGIPDGSGELVLGPLPRDTRAGRLVPLLGFVPPVLAMLAGVVACLPLVRNLRNLEAVARRMREGNFKVRTHLAEGDALQGVGSALNGLADRIDQLLSDERDLMRTVAHEVRAPVSRMRFRVEMLQQSSTGAEVRHASGLVADLAQIDGLFEELLTYVAFDEFDHERPVLSTSTFRSGDAVRAVVNEITDVPAGRRITVQGDEDALVTANRKLFERAVANLVRNAVAYSDSEVRVVLRAFKTACVVDVQDDGPGIPEADRPRVIKPFVRLDAGGRKPRGTGLGLAIVHRIMCLHNSRLHIVDAPRGGASCQLVWENHRVRAHI